MELNETTLKGKWTEIKGEILKGWGKLTSNELDQTKGDLVAIVGLLQQRYGEKKEDYRQKLSDIIERFHAKRDETANSIKENLKN